MKIGTLVRYIGDWHYTIDKGHRVGIVIKANHIFDRLGRRRVLFNGDYEVNMEMSRLEVISDA